MGRATTTGISLHSTRGGAPTLGDEFTSTWHWFASTASQVSAHSVAGEGIIARCVLPKDTAWHNRSWNGTHLGLEMIQSYHGDTIPVSVLDAGAWECAGWVRDYGIPIVHDINVGFCQHYENPPGIADGKTDIEAPFDLADFLSRVSTYRQLLK